MIKALLIDDDNDTYRMIEMLLKRSTTEEFELSCVSCSDEVYEVLSEHSFDVFLVDYLLGAENGLELMQRLDDEGVDVPKILLTGAGDHEVDLRAMDAGAMDYLEKSDISTSTLERSIRYAINNHQQLKRLQKAYEAQEQLSQKLQVSNGIIEQKNEMFHALLELGVKIDQAAELKEMFNLSLQYIQQWIQRWAAPTNTDPSMSEVDVALVLYGKRKGIVECASFSGFTQEEQEIILDVDSPKLKACLKYDILEAQKDLRQSGEEWLALPLIGREQEELGRVVIKIEHIAPDFLEMLELFLMKLSVSAENKLLTRELEVLSNIDALTEVYNRGYFDKCLARELDQVAAFPNLEFSILLIDINGLKQINDEYGHAEGDRLIIQAAKLLKKLCRKSDKLARLGGDEFIILCPATTIEQACTLFDRVKTATEEEFLRYERPDGSEQQLPMRLSIGAASSREGDKKTILNLADERMYEDKKKYYEQNIKYR